MDKPAGVPSQPTLTSDSGTLPDLVAALLGTPVTLVHRLDRETSGVTVLARTQPRRPRRSPRRSGSARRRRPTSPSARARPRRRDGRVDAPLGKDPRARGPPARRPARRRRGDRVPDAPHRARARRSSRRAPRPAAPTRIRVHLARLGAPLLGDARYGGPRRVGEVAIAAGHAARRGGSCSRTPRPARRHRVRGSRPARTSCAAERDLLRRALTGGRSGVGAAQRRASGQRPRAHPAGAGSAPG